MRRRTGVEERAETETTSSTCSSDSEWSKDDETSSQDIQAELKYYGLETHLVSQVCRKTTSQMKSTMNRLTTFLIWLASKILCLSNSVLCLISVLILEHYVLLPGNRYLVYININNDVLS